METRLQDLVPHSPTYLEVHFWQSRSALPRHLGEHRNGILSGPRRNFVYWKWTLEQKHYTILLKTATLLILNCVQFSEVSKTKKQMYLNDKVVILTKNCLVGMPISIYRSVCNMQLKVYMYTYFKPNSHNKSNTSENFDVNKWKHCKWQKTDQPTGCVITL